MSVDERQVMICCWCKFCVVGKNQGTQRGKWQNQHGSWHYCKKPFFKISAWPFVTTDVEWRKSAQCKNRHKKSYEIHSVCSRGVHVRMCNVLLVGSRWLTGASKALRECVWLCPSPAHELLYLNVVRMMSWACVHHVASMCTSHHIAAVVTLATMFEIKHFAVPRGKKHPLLSRWTKRGNRS